MSIDYVLSVNADLLRVKARGRDDDVREVIAYGLAVADAAAKAECSRVLCDETELEYALTTIDTFETARILADRAPRLAKVAIACRPSQIDDARFWETVAVNRGLRVRVFASLAEAEAWIAS
ncbi:MAG: hypothetical protein HC882_05375 [Acidobacteria bacterium]|nr:hypothetical protein [Acidobacteriota bacterium]